MAAAPSEALLSAAVMRSLGDRSYDKRKVGAMEVEKAVRTAHAAGKTAQLNAIVDMLVKDFTCSHNANQRKGGLLALAGVAVGLQEATKDVLDRLVPAVLKCFGDQEPRVRWYATESMFNIAKMAQASILKHFDIIFIGLCKLFADIDVDVKNGAAHLDRLIKDIVTDSEDFDIKNFIPLLQDHMRGTNPYVRVVLVGWIRDLDTVPDIEMLDHLPEFLEGLFDMLSDNNREIRQQAYQALNNFLEEIKKVPSAEFDTRVNFRPMISVLVRQCTHEEKFNRVTAVWWLHQFIQLGGTKLRSVYATLLESVLKCISDAEQVIRKEARDTNADLLALVRDTDGDIELAEILRAVTEQLPSDHKHTRLTALKWISMLMDKAPEHMLTLVDDIMAALLRTLADEADDVVKITLEVLARISLDEAQFLRVLNDIVHLFATKRRLLELRGSFTVRRLCVLMDAKSIYITLAQILADESDFAFASIMIETLSLILLTAEEVTDLREQLRRCVVDNDADGIRVFTTLYNSWCHNPVSTFTLCLLCQAYDLGATVVSRFSESQITVGLLMQIDKLVQLIESPVFLHLRLQLLEVHQPSHSSVLRSLYGVLMLLPQSRAFNTLRNRLMSISSLHIALGASGGPAASKKAKSGTTGEAALNKAKLLERYDEVQARHAAHRRRERAGRRLPGRGGAGGGEPTDGAGGAGGAGGAAASKP